jgi:hypothetical protein
MSNSMPNSLFNKLGDTGITDQKTLFEIYMMTT